MNILGIVNDPLPAGYRVEVSDEGSPMKSATSTAGASLSQLNSPTLSPREVTGWGRGGTDVASPDYGGSLSLHNPPILFPNIARGTTDPEIDSVNWIKFSNNMAPLALVAYLATRWHHLH